MVTNKPKNNALEKLDIGQVASLCCVSRDRVNIWVEKRGLKPLTRGSRHIYCRDLVTFLMQHNMPIPVSVLPVNAKKILFIFSSETLKSIYATFLSHFFKKIKAEENFISDAVCYNRQAKYKILTFAPDLILTYTVRAFDNTLKLIHFAKTTGECRILSIVEEKISLENRVQIKTAGADAVVERSIKINKLVEKIHFLLKQGREGF